LFFIIISTLLILTGAYVRWRLVSPLPLGPRARTALALAFWALVALAPLGLALRRQWPPTLAGQIAGVIGYPILGWLSLIFSLLVLRDLILVLWKIGRNAAVMGLGLSGRPLVLTADPAASTVWLNRTNAAVLVVSLVMGAWGYFQATNIPAVREIRVVIDRLPPSLDGLKIVQITDLHVGANLGGDFVTGVVDRVNQLAPDLIAVTGDMVDGRVAMLADDVAPLAHLKARLGKYFVMGNHEYYSGAAEWIPAVRGLGMDVLLNEHRLVTHKGGRIIVAGITDPRAESFIPAQRSDPFKALAGAPAADVRILLAHQPKSFVEAAGAGIDLQISGHTHGGQFFPWNFVVGLFQPFVAGLFEQGPAQLYVSRGTGFWGPPLRIGAPSEITLIRLRTGKLDTE